MKLNILVSSFAKLFKLSILRRTSVFISVFVDITAAVW